MIFKDSLMTKKSLYILLVLIFVLILLYLFRYNPNKDFDYKKYETKIDALQIKIDSINNRNKALDDYALLIKEYNKTLIQNIDYQNKKIEELKKELKKSKEALSYTPTQVDSFFAAIYPKTYKIYSKDTTRLPIEVSKAVVVDIKDSKINSQLVIKQDSLIKDLNTLVTNKDTLLYTLKIKDLNNLSIIDKKDKQIDFYKIEVGGLKEDLEKNKKQITSLKLKNIALGLGIVGILLIK